MIPMLEVSQASDNGVDDSVSEVEDDDFEAVLSRFQSHVPLPAVHQEQPNVIDELRAARVASAAAVMKVSTSGRKTCPECGKACRRLTQHCRWMTTHL